MSKKKSKPVRPTSKATERWRAFKAWIKTPQSRKLRGSIYLLLSVFLAVAMVAFFLDTHWLGKVGELMAGFFVQHLFGVASLGVSLLLLVYGLKLLDHELLPWSKTFWCTLNWMVWLSTTLGYIGGKWVKDSSFENYAGIGLSFGEVLDKTIGAFSLVALAFWAILFLIFVHKVNLKMPKIELPKLEPRPQKIKEQPVKELKSKESKPSSLVDLDALESMNAPLPVEDAPKVETEEVELRIHSHEPEPEFPKQEEVKFDIDDEFERINKRARSEKADTEVAFSIDETHLADSSESTLPAEVSEESTPLADDDYRRHYGIDEPYDPHLDLKDFKMPSTDILEDWEVRNTKVTKEELVANKDKIVATLKNYGIEIVEISASPGPTVTLYEIKPAPGIRISKIKSLEDDIALSLAALGIRIIAPIPGKGTIGIEVPNANPQIVAMKTMLTSDAFLNNTKFQLPIALGKTISNEPYVTDLAKMPHLLMAGATGTGKSVGLNAVIASLLFKKHPSELKFVMVDPKKVELSLYSKIERHYLAKLPDSEEAIITDVKKVVRTLNSLCIEMDQRYDLLKLAQVRKITEYNEKFCKRMLNPENGHRFLPYIVLVIDEFADLIMTAGREVETPIARLAQLARAVGIHLIIATQRPTTNIITGTIKANFPARIAFRVSSGIDSRTILDTGGANQLIGRGDMLISLAGSDLIRVQCALIETEEIDKLADFIGEQRGYPDGFLLPEYLDENDEPTKDFDPKQKDEFFNDAARLVVASQFGSTSLLQRKLSLGYNRAGRIIDQLEAAGIVGAYNGSKAREVLIKDEVELEELLRSL